MNLVLPRDLFNHAKVLKCYGQLALKIHDYGYYSDLVSLSLFGNTFNIEQNEGSGDLYISNLKLFTKQGREIELDCKYNSREFFTMFYYLEHPDEDIEDYCGEVFNRDGSFSDEFEHMLTDIRKGKV